MKKARHPLLFVFLSCITSLVHAQAPSHVRTIFPEKTVVYSNIPYAGDTSQKHQLDIYLPETAGNKTPLVVWFHGGAWMLNDKYADMGYMKNTVRGLG